MSATMRLEMVTPNGVEVDEEVEMVTLPGCDGELGIYPGHVPLMTPLIPGELVIQTPGNHERVYAIGEGIVEVTMTHVSIIADEAIEADKLDEHKVQQEMERTQEALKRQISAEEIADLSGRLARIIARAAAIRHQRH